MSLPHPLNAYDPRTGQLLRSTDQLAVELGPVESVLLALPEAAFAQSPMFRLRKTPRCKRGNPGSIGRIAAVNVVNLMRSTRGKQDCALFRKDPCRSEWCLEAAAILVELVSGQSELRICSTARLRS